MYIPPELIATVIFDVSVVILGLATAFAVHWRTRVMLQHRCKSPALGATTVLQDHLLTSNSSGCGIPTVSTIGSNLQPLHRIERPAEHRARFRRAVRRSTVPAGISSSKLFKNTMSDLWRCFAAVLDRGRHGNDIHFTIGAAQAALLFLLPVRDSTVAVLIDIKAPRFCQL